MPPCQLEIYRVMRRSNFHRPGAEGGINGIVGNDGDGSINYRENNFFAYQAVKTPILGIYRYCGVAEICLGTGGSYGNKAFAIG